MKTYPRLHLRISLAACVLGLAFQAAASGQELLRIDGHAITLEQVAAANPAALSNPEVRQQVAEQLAQQQVLADQAPNPPASVTSRIEAAQANVKRQALAQYVADEYLKAHAPSKDAIEAAYEKLVAAMPVQQYWVRWIVVESPQQASKLLDTLKSGGSSFTELAVNFSVGLNAEMGGALGWQTEKTLPAAVLGAIQKLHSGQVAGPIALDSGYAIVQLVAVRPAPKPSLDQLKPQIEQQLRSTALQEYIQSLAKKVKVQNMQTTEPAPTTSAPHGDSDAKP